MLLTSVIGAGAAAIAAVLLSTLLDGPTPPDEGGRPAGTAVELPTAAGTATAADVPPPPDPPTESAVLFTGCGEPAEPAPETTSSSWTTHADAPFRGEPVVDERGQVLLIGRTPDGATRLAHWVPPRVQWGCATVHPGLSEELKVAAGEDIVAAFDGDDVALLDLPGQTWQHIAAPPITGPALGVGFSSGQLLVFAHAGSTIAAANYDLETETWSELAGPDANVSRATVVPFGSRFVVLGNWSGGTQLDGDAPAIARIYDPAADAWDVLPPVELSPLSVVGAEAGGRLLVVDYLMQAAVYDPLTDQWQSLPDVPLAPEECSPTLLPAARETVVLERCGQFAAIDASTGRWATVEPPGASAVQGRVPGQLVARQDLVFLLADDGPTFATRPASWLE